MSIDEKSYFFELQYDSFASGKNKVTLYALKFTYFSIISVNFEYFLGLVADFNIFGRPVADWPRPTGHRFVPLADRGPTGQSASTQTSL